MTVFRVEVKVDDKLKYGHSSRVSDILTQDARKSEVDWAIDAVEQLLRRMKVEAGYELDEHPNKSGAV